MEFIRNNINAIDVQNKIQEQIKTDKVHASEEINVKNDLKDNKKNKYKKSKEQKPQKSKTITIDVIKNYEDKVSIEIEKIENINVDNSKGRFLDAKK